MNYVDLLNKIVIPCNWDLMKTIMQKYTKKDQKIKIIEEIVEFYVEHRDYQESPCEEVNVRRSFELADVVLSCCTMLKVKGINEINDVNGKIRCGTSPIDWIGHVVAGGDENIIHRAFEYAEQNDIDLIDAVQRKLEYNKTRKDWRE